MIENDSPKVLEFNVRFGDPETQPILYRLESDLLDLINAVVDERLSETSINYAPCNAVCVVMTSGGYPNSYEKGFEICGLDQAQVIPNTIVFHAGTSLKNGKFVTNGGRVLGITARGKTIEEAIKTAYLAVKKIHWKDVHFRNDIAMKALHR
jgi:phosphoribosylamine--glycine ligase